MSFATAWVFQELQVGHAIGGLDQHPYRGVEIAGARRQHAAVVEFDDLAADLGEQRLAHFFHAGLDENALDLGDHVAVLMVLGGDLAENFLRLFGFAVGQAGVGEIDGDLLRDLFRTVTALQFVMQGQGLVQRLAGLLGSPPRGHTGCPSPVRPSLRAGCRASRGAIPESPSGRPRGGRCRSWRARGWCSRRWS